MSLIKEFKDFAVKGNVIDLAIGVVIGSAFGKIVTSLVNDIIMPPLGMILGGLNFKEWKIMLQAAATDSTGKAVPAVTLNIGNFIQQGVDLLIISASIFLVVKSINSFKKVKQDSQQPTHVSSTDKILIEIKALLEKQNK